jgi:gentisate 1,2-dioxygenase
MWVKAEHYTNRTPVSHRIAAELSPAREYAHDETDIAVDTIARLRRSCSRLLKGHPHVLGALTRGFLARY